MILGIFSVVLLLPVAAGALICRRLYLQHEESTRLEEEEATGAGACADRLAMSDEEADRLRREREIIAQMELDFHSR